MNFTDRRRNTHSNITASESEMQSAKNEFRSSKAKADKHQQTL